MAPGGDDSAPVADHPGALARPPTREPAPARSRIGHTTLQAATPRTPTLSIETAADALRDEEVERTRMFIGMGWLVSLAALAIVPLLGGPLPMRVVFVAGLVIGMIASYAYYRAFADHTRYTDRALAQLSVISVVNGHIAVLYYGLFTAVTGIIVIGIHFAARTEREQLARAIYLSGIICYLALVLPLVLGWFADPGVFASERPIDTRTQLVGAGFVIGVYTLAYVTARAFRKASLRSIEQLQRATRLASQRQALLEELRVDLERALRIGAPGRHTGEVVGELTLGVLLGRGAMGEVYEAVHRHTGAPAAVKLLRRELLADPTHVARFLREVRASGSLASPHVVHVLDASVDGAALPYLAMERLHGLTLAEVLRKEAKLPAAQLAELVRQIGAGIDAAARAGIVHRDLKPQNLFRHTGAVWKILDFGVATLVEESSGTLTQGGIVGTPHYMAPEQAQAKRVDSRADLYALGMIAFRALTGRHAYPAIDTPALLYAVVHEMPPRPSALVDLPADVDRWFALALAKSPDHRFASGAAMAAALDDALAGTLDPALRRRADALVRERAWSTP